MALTRVVMFHSKLRCGECLLSCAVQYNHVIHKIWQILYVTVNGVGSKASISDVTIS